MADAGNSNAPLPMLFIVRRGAIATTLGPNKSWGESKFKFVTREMKKRSNAVCFKKKSRIAVHRPATTKHVSYAEGGGVHVCLTTRSNRNHFCARLSLSYRRHQHALRNNLFAP